MSPTDVHCRGRSRSRRSATSAMMDPASGDASVLRASWRPVLPTSLEVLSPEEPAPQDRRPLREGIARHQACRASTACVDGAAPGPVGVWYDQHRMTARVHPSIRRRGRPMLRRHANARTDATQLANPRGEPAAGRGRVRSWYRWVSMLVWRPVRALGGCSCRCSGPGLASRTRNGELAGDPSISG